MAEILTMGEIIVEIMREKEDSALFLPDTFKGPYPSGAPAIFTDTVARLGRSSAIIGAVGNDDFGKCLTDRLKKDGVSLDYVNQSSESFTGCAFVTYFSDGSRKYIFHFDNSAAVDVKSPDLSKETNLKYFHIMGCSLMLNDRFGNDMLSIAEQLSKKGVKISFDPNIRKELMRSTRERDKIQKVLEITNIFLPGKEELLLLSQKNNIKDAIEWCFSKNNMEIVVVKNGSKGCTVYTKDNAFSLGVYNISPIDATGAGDSFDAAFLCGILDGKNLEYSAKYASATAALNTIAFGPMEGDISKEKVETFMKTEEIEVTPCHM